MGLPARLTLSIDTPYDIYFLPASVVKGLDLANTLDQNFPGINDLHVPFFPSLNLFFFLSALFQLAFVASFMILDAPLFLLRDVPWASLHWLTSTATALVNFF